MHSLYFSFFFSRYGDHLDLHSFPTRRSSDLEADRFVLDLRLEEVPAAFRPAREDLRPVRRLQKGQPVAFFISPHNIKNATGRSEEHTSELQSRENLVCRLLLEKKKKKK